MRVFTETPQEGVTVPVRPPREIGGLLKIVEACADTPEKGNPAL